MRTLAVAAALVLAATGLHAGAQEKDLAPAARPTQAKEGTGRPPANGERPQGGKAESGSKETGGKQSGQAPGSPGTSETVSAERSYAVPPAETMLVLVRQTLTALNLANVSGNYGVLHAISSPGLQAESTPETLAQTFQPIRDLKVNLAPILILTPEVTEPPRIDPPDVLTISGFFPTTPFRTDFNLKFVPHQNQWRIRVLSVSLVPVETAARKTGAP